MSFFDKVKQWLGIGGVKLKLELPSAVLSKESGHAEGKVMLTTKSDQHVEHVEFELEEEYTTGSGETKRTKLFTLGKSSHAGAFTLKAGESKELSFKIPFSMVASNNDRMKEKGGVVGALGKLGKMMDNERSVYKLKAGAKVKGAAFQATDSVEVTIR